VDYLKIKGLLLKQIKHKKFLMMYMSCAVNLQVTEVRGFKEVGEEKRKEEALRVERKKLKKRKHDEEVLNSSKKL
jgi:hypothetical protein